MQSLPRPFAAAAAPSRTRRHFRVRKKVVRHARCVRAWSSPVRRATCSCRSSTTPPATRWSSASTLDEGIRGAAGDKTAKAAQVGKLVAERGQGAGIAKVVFDRGGNRYHGRIAALADAAREARTGVLMTKYGRDK